MFAKRIISAVLGVLLIGALAACEKQQGEGPGERVGKEVDKTMDQLGEKMKEAGEKVKEATKN